MSDPVYRKGDIIVCFHGHVVGEVLEDVHLGDMPWADKFGNWAQDHMPPKFGTLEKPVCAICGGPVFKPKGDDGFDWYFYTTRPA